MRRTPNRALYGVAHVRNVLTEEKFETISQSFCWRQPLEVMKSHELPAYVFRARAEFQLANASS